MTYQFAREPSCVHSHDYGSPFEQPMSWCSTCKDSPALAEWRRYWNEEGAQFVPPMWPPTEAPIEAGEQP